LPADGTTTSLEHQRPIWLGRRIKRWLAQTVRASLHGQRIGVRTEVLVELQTCRLGYARPLA